MKKKIQLMQEKRLTKFNPPFMMVMLSLNTTKATQKGHGPRDTQ